MEGRTIILPASLTAANSKELLRECRRTLRNEALCLDGSALTRMDYSGDAFFALLADLSEKTGNKLSLAHFNEEIKAQLRALKKEKIPEKVKNGYSNFLEATGAKTIVIAKEVAEVFILLNMCIYWMICGPFDKGRSKFGGTAKQLYLLGTEATGICFLMVGCLGTWLPYICRNQPTFDDHYFGRTLGKLHCGRNRKHVCLRRSQGN